MLIYKYKNEKEKNMTKEEFLEELKDEIHVFLDVDFTQELKDIYEENFGQIDPDWSLEELNDAFCDLRENAEDDMVEDFANTMWDWLEGITTKQTYPEDAPGQLHLFGDDE